MVVITVWGDCRAEQSASRGFTAQDLSWGSRRTGYRRCVAQPPADLERIEPDRKCERDAGKHERGRDRPCRSQRVDIVTGIHEHRKKCDRAEDGAEGRADENERNAPSSALFRIHVGGACAGQVHRTRAASGQGHSDHEWRQGSLSRSEVKQTATGSTNKEAESDARRTSARIHVTPGEQRGNGPADDEDGRCEAGQAWIGGKIGKRRRRHGHEQLNGGPNQGQARRQHNRVAPNRALKSRLGHGRQYCKPADPLQ